jgi:DNA-binding winged helix-turn-helix (wHTH) protein/Tol biopolymer transport system component
MSMGNKGLQFGDFLLDRDQQVLLRDGRPVPLTPKAYQLLSELIENHGRIVEKGQLMEAVWPDSFVEEGNLSFTVNLIRKALDDSRSDPRYIETVSKRGYRFIAEVNQVSASISSQDDGGIESVQVPGALPVRSGHTWIVGSVAAVALVLLLGVGAWYFAKREAVGLPILARRFTVEQLSTSGASSSAAISPDGKYVAFSDESGGRQSLWLRDIETSENIQILPPSDDDYLSLTFANSGKSLYFVRLSKGTHGLPSAHRLDLFSGIPEKVIDNVIRRIDVSPDDRQIAFARCNFRKDDFCGVFLADANGANERRLWTADSAVHIYDVRYSPDGASLAVAHGRFANEKNDATISELKIASGEMDPMFSERFFRIGSVEWIPDGSGILFAASHFREGKESIWTLAHRGGKIEPATRDAGSYTMLSLDATATKLVAVDQKPDYQIRVINNGGTRSLTGAREVALSSAGKLVYATFDGEIWSANLQGGEQRQLTKSEVAETSIIISPDARTIYFSSDEGGARQVWRMDADGSERRPLTQNSGGYPVSLSADGSTVFYTDQALGEVYRVPVNGGNEELLHKGRVPMPRVSPDGSVIAQITNEGMVRKPSLIDVPSGNEKKLTVPAGETLSGRGVQWSPDSRSLYYMTQSSSGTSLWVNEIAADKPTKLADLGGGEVLGFTVASDGTIAFVSGGWRRDVMLLRGLL